ncbi:hypothetical protein XspCFBP7912_09100 [Xanthomonas sp. CFBP 7912]|nr:hypothetical protein XspCFBP7912_09100 [Xanthomonas sp. CFBP 7912]RJS02995.1 hypothetical protein XnspCFBP7698_15710 [Xanthomonas sp. CFBP 7698]
MPVPACLAFLACLAFSRVRGKVPEGRMGGVVRRQLIETVARASKPVSACTLAAVMRVSPAWFAAWLQHLRAQHCVSQRPSPQPLSRRRERGSTPRAD